MHPLPQGRRGTAALISCSTTPERLACPCLTPTGHREGRVQHRRCDACGFGCFAPVQAFDRDYGPPTDHPLDPRNDPGDDEDSDGLTDVQRAERNEADLYERRLAEVEHV